MTPDERWVRPTPAEIAELTLARERGPMILDDVRRLPAAPANEAVVAQVRAYCARPWANVPVEAFIRPFLCECADPACDAVVELRVTAFPPEPLLAPGHG